jgi:endonuclease-3
MAASRTREELEALPGVGRKTANVVLNVAFGQPHGRGHAHLPRQQPHGAGARKNPLEVEKQLLKAYPTNTRWTPITG